VFDPQGRVVATVVGYVEWSWGGAASIIVALPPPLTDRSSAQYSQYTEMEVKQMGFFESLIPMLKLGGAAGVALALYQAVLPLIRRSFPFSAEALGVVMGICEKVVMAVEQSHGDLASIDKKALAQQLIAEIVGRLGLHPPQALIDAGIESAVLALNRALGQKAA
jgi:hypothetical protein